MDMLLFFVALVQYIIDSDAWLEGKSTMKVHEVSCGNRQSIES